MKTPVLKLIVALLTFSVGVAVFSLWNKFNPVDERLANAINALETEQIDVSFKKCRCSSEECERMKRFAKSQIPQRVAEDLENANKICRRDNLSEAQCAQRKELGIKDIEENRLGK